MSEHDGSNSGRSLELWASCKSILNMGSGSPSLLAGNDNDSERREAKKKRNR